VDRDIGLLLGTIPFLVLLILLAFGGLIERSFPGWAHPGIQLSVVVAVTLPSIWWSANNGLMHSVVNAGWMYVRFAIYILALLATSSRVIVDVESRIPPLGNALIILGGAVLASCMGTPAATAILARSLARSNQRRRMSPVTLVAFIGVVANGGGLLTPLGDPPLLLGFLSGVPFFWSFRFIGPWLLVNGILTGTALVADMKMWKGEGGGLGPPTTQLMRVSIQGWRHVPAFALVVGAMFLLPSWDTTTHSIPAREIVMVLAALGGAGGRRAWAPILESSREVLILFVGLFICLVPIAPLLSSMLGPVVRSPIGAYFSSGAASSVLDNSVTYLAFFDLGRDPGYIGGVAGLHGDYLAAISLGTVLWGSLTYLGNGPNLIAKGIWGSSTHWRLPGFAEYLSVSSRVILPPLLAVPLLFLPGSPSVMMCIGVLVAPIGLFHILMSPAPRLDGVQEDREGRLSV
jgi:Na+/H+ antiporter NhaD/arsenite permease-like protein